MKVSAGSSCKKIYEACQRLGLAAGLGTECLPCRLVAAVQTGASHFVLEFGEAAFTSPNVVSSYAADGCEAATSEIGDLRRIRKPSAYTRGKMRR